MMKTMKKTITIMLMVLVMMSVATAAFAATQDYEFHYNGAYDSHSSSYIAGPATIDNGQVTITLSGNNFPAVKVNGVIYSGTYDASTNLTTFTFPGSNASDIALELYVYVPGIHSTWYPLTLVWI